MTFSASPNSIQASLICRLMSMIRLFVSILLFFVFTGWANESWIVQNSSARAVFRRGNSGQPVLDNMTDLVSGRTLLGMYERLTMYCGDQAAAGLWEVEQISSERLNVKAELDCYPGIGVSISYRLIGREMLVDARFESKKTVEIENGLSWYLGSGIDHILTSNHLGNSEKHEYRAAKPTYVHFNQMNKLVGGVKIPMAILVPNPFHAFLRLDSLPQRNAWLDIFPIQPSSTPHAKEGSWSQLLAGEAFSRSFRISVGEFSQQRVFISEHPYGWDYSIAMYWDEFPNRDNWLPVTTAVNPLTPIYSMIVEMLEKFPNMKLGMVLLTDRTVDRKKSSFAGWETSDYRVIPDTLDELKGQACVNMIGTHLEDSLSITQTFTTMSYGSLNVTLNYKNSDHSRSRICLEEGNTKQCVDLDKSSTWISDTAYFNIG